MNRTHLLLVVLTALMWAPACSAKQEKKTPPKDGIISLAPNVTEILFALNLEDRVVGVTTACDYPPEARDIKPMGGFMTPHFEAIVGSGATWVVAMEGGIPPKDVSRLEAAGKNVLLLKDKTVKDVLSSMERLGAELGVAEAGKKLRAAVEKELAPTPFGKVEGQPKAMLVISKDPLMVAGPDTFVGELMVIAGLKNAVEESALAYPAWDREAVINANPDWIITACMEDTRDGDAPLWNHLKSVEAVQKKQIRTVNPDWVLRPGPRMGKGVRALREALKPRSREGR